MDGKVIRIIIASLVVGAVLTYSLSLYHTTGLEEQLLGLRLEVDRLRGEELKARNLEGEIHGLEAVNGNLRSSMTSLQGERTNLTGLLRSKSAQVARLNLQLSALQSNYTDLMGKYAALTQPASQNVSIGNFSLTLSVTKILYRYTEPVQGEVRVFYRTGEPFTGEVNVYVVDDEHRSGISHGNWQVVNGTCYFTIQAPVFLYGPGRYTIFVMGLYESGGAIIGQWEYDDPVGQLTSIQLVAV